MHYFVLTLLFATVYFLVVGVLGYEWYIMEIASLFLVLGIASGLAVDKSASDIAKLFLEGMGDILSAAVIVGLAGGIVIILQDGGIIDTILYGLSKSMSNMGKIASAEIMYGIQTLINIVIPSGSAKAAITMPIMAPFSDLIGISRQATVVAFQFGDGFTNMITPTLFAQVETAEAVENADAIAAVEGVDVLFVGPADLQFDLKARNSSLAFEDCLARVASAAKAAGKAAGILTRDDSQVAPRLAMGYTHQAVDSDLGILRRRYAELVAIKQ